MSLSVSYEEEGEGRRRRDMSVYHTVHTVKGMERIDGKDAGLNNNLEYKKYRTMEPLICKPHCIYRG